MRQYLCAIILVPCLAGFIARAGDEMAGADLRLRSQIRPAATEWTAGKFRLSGIVAEPCPGVRANGAHVLAPSDVFQPTTVQVVVEVKAGWNMLSLPFDYPGTVSGLLVSPTGSLILGLPMAWDGLRLCYEPLLGEVPGGQGFWVWAVADGQVVVRGTRRATPGVPLVAGWNLAGPVWDGTGLGDAYQLVGGHYVVVADCGFGRAAWVRVVP